MEKLEIIQIIPNTTNAVAISEHNLSIPVECWALIDDNRVIGMVRDKKSSSLKLVNNWIEFDEYGTPVEK